LVFVGVDCGDFDTAPVPIRINTVTGDTLTDSEEPDSTPQLYIKTDGFLCTFQLLNDSPGVPCYD
jgi:hypothetical protein